jgi:hypothetical protein
MEIRSYRRVFDLERRVYSIDSLRLNPGGVPVRGILYFAAILCTVLLISHLPLLGQVVEVLPWYMRDLFLPGASATVLGMIRVEGRTFHLAAFALWRCLLGPRLFHGLCPCASVGQRWYPQDILMLPDGSDSRMRRMRYEGPGAVLIAVEHERNGSTVEKGSAGFVRGGRKVDVKLTEAVDGRALESAKVLLLGPQARVRVSSRAAHLRVG